MPRFAVNISILLNEYPFLERFSRAAQLGFDSVEFFYPYAYKPSQLQELLKDNGLRVVLFNVFGGDMGAGERGYASYPEQRAKWRGYVEQALEWAHHLGCRQVNTLSGKRLPDVRLEDQWECLIDNLRWAAPLAESAGVAINIEPLNTIDSPGYLLDRSSQALDLISKTGSPNLKLQYDVYHMQMMEGNLISTIKANLDRIGHIQIADVPGRNQPGTGEINYPAIFAALDDMGYRGFVSMEYKPRGTSEESFSWLPVAQRKSQG